MVFFFNITDIESLTEEFSLLTNKVREEITIGSLVEVSISDQTLVGTVRWCGRLLNQSKSHQIVAGIELVRASHLKSEIRTLLKKATFQ